MTDYDKVHITRDDEVSDLEVNDTVEQPSWKPTRKLVSAVATLVALYLLRLVVEVDEELEEIVNLVVPVIVAYVVPNQPTPGGVPEQ